MKAKSRKRLLISSVAMLLVAMLALGTATFAWFTTSTSTTADKINVSTVKASDLKISRWNHSWVDGFSYNYTNAAMKPASSSDGNSWFTAEAGAKDNFQKKTGTNFVALSTPSIDNFGIENYVFMEELNIQNAGQSAATGVKITIQGKINNYVKIALVPSDENHVVTGTFGAAGTVFGNDTEAYYPAASASAASDTAITTNNTLTVNVGTMAAGAEVYYRLYVWYEGQDTDCKDINPQTLPNLSFAITGTTGQS